MEKGKQPINRLCFYTFLIPSNKGLDTNAAAKMGH